MTDPKAARTESKREKRWVLLGFSPRAGSLARPQPCCPLRTIILRATPSSCEASRRMRCAILSGGPPSGAGRERCARTLFPETKWSWTAAVSFFSARRPCHTIGYFCREREKKSQHERTKGTHKKRFPLFKRDLNCDGNPI